MHVIFFTQKHEPQNHRWSTLSCFEIWWSSWWNKLPNKPTTPRLVNHFWWSVAGRLVWTDSTLHRLWFGFSGDCAVFIRVEGGYFASLMTLVFICIYALYQHLQRRCQMVLWRVSIHHFGLSGTPLKVPVFVNCSCSSCICCRCRLLASIHRLFGS